VVDPRRGSRVLTAWKREGRQVNQQLDGRCAMGKKQYEPPKVFELGTVKELTETTPEADKCSGSGDQFTLSEAISPNYSGDCP
jgi:hypothetical protein